MIKPKNKFVRLNTTANINKLILVGLLVFFLGFNLWWGKVRNNPEAIFWSAVANSLQTQSVTKIIEQENNNGSIKEVTNLYFSGSPKSRAVTTLTQQNQEIYSKVVTESLGTKDADFVRYVEIIADGGQQADRPDYTSVLGVWAKPPSDSGSGQFVVDALAGVIPFGDVSIRSREQIIQLLKQNKAYFIEGITKNKDSRGRNVTEYDVTLSPEKYFEALELLNTALGIKSNIFPQDYATQPSISLVLVVDNISRRFVEIRYSGGSSVEKLTGYGVYADIKIPTETISTEQLQEKLQKVR